MALRSLATKMWTPAASSLRRRPGPSMPPAAARSRFLGTTSSQAEQHAKASSNAARPLKSVDDLPLDEELYKIGDAIRERREELGKAYGEIKRIAKWYACTIVGVPVLLWNVKF